MFKDKINTFLISKHMSGGIQTAKTTQAVRETGRRAHDPITPPPIPPALKNTEAQTTEARTYLLICRGFHTIGWPFFKNPGTIWKIRGQVARGPLGIFTLARWESDPRSYECNTNPLPSGNRPFFVRNL